MLINESIVFPPAGAAAPRWCRFRFRRPFFMCVSRLFFRQRGRMRHYGFVTAVAKRRSIMILISSNQEPKTRLKNSNHAQPRQPPQRVTETSALILIATSVALNN